MTWCLKMYPLKSSTCRWRSDVWRFLVLVGGFHFLSGTALAQVLVTDPFRPTPLDGQLSLYIEKGDQRSAEQIHGLSSEFQLLHSSVIGIMDDDCTYWVRLGPVVNLTEEKLLINMANPLVDTVQVFRLSGETETLFHNGAAFRYPTRDYDDTDFLADLKLVPGDSAYYLFRLRSKERIVVPFSLGTERGMLGVQSRKDLILGLFFGIMLVIVLYNFSLYLITKERVYVWYVLYIGFFTLTQAGFTGYSFQYLFPDWPLFFNKSLTVFAGLAGIFAIFFARDFLHIRQFTPKLDKGLNVFLVTYGMAILLSLGGWRHQAFGFIDFSGMFLSLYGFVFSSIIAFKGYRPAKFFLIAWSVFLIGMVLFVLRNLGIIPHNFITGHTLQIGSALEAILFSIALADKINILKREKELSQAQSLQLALENERIIKEQNVVLENRVRERTGELEEANAHLKATLVQLKDAQAQLVNAEKMASLGQLTAGIAHEINNPINFVSSNIRPLRRDIEDLLTIIRTYDERTSAASPGLAAEMALLKQQLDFDYLQEELQTLISGIEEGATRTAEIVKGLRIFSRVDESDLKDADINQGIDSTLILLNSSMGGKINVQRDYAADAVIECFPGKLNQVFMNILTNAIQAMQSAPPAAGGILFLQTRKSGDELVVTIRDNGPGIPEEVKARIFEPFFTTKRVGQGTGLGLSIVHAIIESHKGSLQVDSRPGEGATFTIHLPIRHS